MFYRQVVVLLKKICFILLITIFFFNNAPTVFADEINVSAKSAILICADTSEVVFAKNETERLSMASTTKIMTALLTLEAAQVCNREVSITDTMVRVEGSSMGLRAGDVVTLDTLAKGMLTCSGNDAANSAAISLAGDTESFAKLMNERAKQIGMLNTNFVTPSGLDDDDHYTTAYDMSLLGAHAMKNPVFKEIASQKSVTVDFIKPQKRVSYSNHNKLITLYRGCIGVKTGFTKKSGRCLVSCAERDGVRLVAVTLNAPDDWNDHTRMFDYGFSKVKRVTFDDTNMNLQEPVISSPKKSILVSCKDNISLTVNSKDFSKINKKVKISKFLYAPIEKNQVVGSVDYELNGKVLASTDLVSCEEAELEEKLGFWKRFSNLFK